MTAPRGAVRAGADGEGSSMPQPSAARMLAYCLNHRGNAGIYVWSVHQISSRFGVDQTGSLASVTARTDVTHPSRNVLGFAPQWPKRETFSIGRSACGIPAILADHPAKSSGDSGKNVAVIVWSNTKTPEYIREFSRGRPWHGPCSTAFDRGALGINGLP
jgi:hypothetical protein